MINFQMTTSDNFASFCDDATGAMVFVDSFDNEEFNIRMGDLLTSITLGTIKAKNDNALNIQLTEIYNKSTKIQVCQ